MKKLILYILVLSSLVSCVQEIEPELPYTINVDPDPNISGEWQFESVTFEYADDSKTYYDICEFDDTDPENIPFYYIFQNILFEYDNELKVTRYKASSCGREYNINGVVEKDKNQEMVYTPLFADHYTWGYSFKIVEITDETVTAEWLMLNDTFVTFTRN